MSGGLRSAALSSATVLLVLAAPRPSAAQTVDTRDHERRVTGLQEIGIAVGALDYTESNAGVSLFDTGASLGSADYSEDPFRTRGGWFQAQSQYEFFSWLALAVRARLGTMTRGPSTVPPSDETVDGGDPGTLDPQLGDPRLGGSVAPIIRFLPGHTALDVGATFSFTSFRPRYGGDGVSLDRRCGDCYAGQDGFQAFPLWPTLRVSSTGHGAAWAVGTGEGFVQTNEPGPIELLVGMRGRSYEVFAGVARGLALRADAHVSDGWWFSVHASAKPWGKRIDGHEASIWIVALGLTQRWSSFAPL